MSSISTGDIPIGYIYCEVIFNKSKIPVDFRYIDCNLEFEKITNKSKDYILGKKSREVFDCKENVSNITTAGIKAIASEDELSLEYHDVKKQRWYKMIAKSLDSNHFTAFFIDITENIKLDKKLDLENRRLREIVQGTQTGIWEWDMINGSNIVNENWAEIIGYRAEELNPITHEEWRCFIHPDDIEKSDELIKKHINGETDFYITEFRIKHKKGYWIWVLERGKIISHTESGEPEIMIGTHIDITDRKHKQEEIEYLSYHDQLTGIHNRRYFEEEIKKIDVEENLPISLIVADVNGLKLTNDAFGHQAGDLLIKRAATILKENSRSIDLVARIGGDEFVIVLPKTNGVNAGKINNRYYDITSKTKLDPVSVSMAMGFATKYSEKEDLMCIFREAEQNMYNRKMKESKSVKEYNLESIIESFFESEGFEKSHSDNVSKISELIGREVGMKRSELEHLKLASSLHDIGSIGTKKTTFGDISDTADIDDHDMREMKRHSEVGYQILKSVNKMVPVAEYVLYHHERWDGKGYPAGLKGKEIPLHSRIISIVDSYDMMINFEKRSKKEAIEEIRRGSGTRFDPKLVDVFIGKVEDN